MATLPLDQRLIRNPAADERQAALPTSPSALGPGKPRGSARLTAEEFWERLKL